MCYDVRDVVTQTGERAAVRGSQRLVAVVANGFTHVTAPHLRRARFYSTYGPRCIEPRRLARHRFETLYVYCDAVIRICARHLWKSGHARSTEHPDEILCDDPRDVILQRGCPVIELV